jgi:hypothetical protein
MGSMPEKVFSHVSTEERGGNSPKLYQLSELVTNLPRKIPYRI